MFGFEESVNHFNDLVADPQPHQGKWSHELLGAVAGAYGMHEWEQSQRANGETVSHPIAKELLAGFAGGAVDKLVETKGLDFVERERLKHQAKKQADHFYEEQYSQYDQYDPSTQDPHPALENINIREYNNY